jgi:hypothetical protein
MTRGRLRLITFGGLAMLFALVVAVPVGDMLGVVLFALVILLVGIWVFRFGPHGDAWDWAEELGMNPWLLILLILLLGAVWGAFRLGLLQAAV